MERQPQEAGTVIPTVPSRGDIATMIPVADVRHPAVRRVCKLVHERITERWTLAHAANLAGLNRSYFSVLFRRETGMPFHVYVERCRIALAGNLLLEGQLLIAEISAAGGYEDITTFDRAFKRCKGVTPRMFRHSSWSLSAEKEISAAYLIGHAYVGRGVKKSTAAS